MQRRRWHLWLPVLALLAGPLMADDIDQDEALRLRQSGSIRPVEELLAAAMQRWPGAQLLELELEKERGRYIYEFELVTRSGEVRELEFDAGSGELLRDRRDD